MWLMDSCPVWECRVWTLVLVSLTFCTSNEYLAGREHIVGGRIGEDVYLPCDVDLRMCGKIYFITWTKNSTKDWDRVYLFSDAYEKSMGFLSEPDRATFTLQQSSAYLRIKSLAIEDEGTYKCDVTYIQGKCPSLSYVHLYVVVEPGEPYLEVEKERIPNGTTIGPYYESSTLLLHCRLPGGRPVPGIRWWNGTSPMPYKVGIKTNSDWTYDVTSTMRFVISRFDLGARFECIIENNVTKTYHSMWILLDIFVRPKSISLRGPTTEVVAGEMVSLTCSVDGARPSANVTWYNRTEVIKPQPPSNRDLMSDGTYRTTSTLVFVASRHDHARDFFCKGTNQVLQKKHEAPLLQAIRLEVLYPPLVFLRPEGVLAILEHELANITCSYDANPPNITEIFWYRDGVAIQPKRNIPKNPQHRSQLFFQNISRHDAGLYSCHVRNAFGRANSTNHLQVNVIYPPEVAVQISPDTFTEGVDHTVRIVCKVENGNPAQLDQVRWFFNESPINQSVSGGEAEIKLEGVQRHFRGKYSCQGRNTAGWSATSPTKSLQVRYAPGAATVKQEGEMAIKGKPVTLVCQLENAGFPAASMYRWERNGLLLKNCTSATCVTGPAGVATQGNYTCAAINEVGGGQAGSLALKVQAPPQFLYKPPPISGALRNATHVSLVCHVECQPLCEVYWLHNNQRVKNSINFVQNNRRHDGASQQRAAASFPSVISSLSWSMSSLSLAQLDNSSFSCHSTGNEAGPGVQSVTQFHVEYPPEHISIPAVEIMLTEGEVADELLCSASAHPMGQYMWITGGKVVSRSPTLFINSSVSRAMGGRYTCIVTNRHGKAEAELKITVLHKPDCQLKKEYDSNGNALLSCAATGEPPVFNFTWQKNNTTMEEIAGMGFETVSRYVVSRDNHQQNGYGIYSCTVTNAIGSSESCLIEVDSLPSPSGWVQLLLQEESMIIVACVVGGVAISGILVIVTFLIVLMRRRVRAVDGIGERQNADCRDPSPEHVLNGKTSGGTIAEKRDWTPLLNDHDETVSTLQGGRRRKGLHWILLPPAIKSSRFGSSK